MICIVDDLEENFKPFTHYSVNGVVREVVPGWYYNTTHRLLCQLITDRMWEAGKNKERVGKFNLAYDYGPLGPYNHSYKLETVDRWNFMIALEELQEHMETQE
jgi:hypothetical protein